VSVPARVLRLTLAYEGTEYHGWQYQPGASTVQGLLMDACRRILGDPVKVTGASRTDAGVHALRQVASVSTRSAMEVSRIARALNAVLPPAVRVIEVRPAPPGFDARRSAVAKRYAYLLDRGPVADPFLRRFAWHPPYALDVGAMAGALPALRGKHDFSAFCAAPGRGRTPTCTVLSARVVERKHRVAILLSADSFLHHMVRNVVGSVIEVGRGARPPAWLDEILSGRDRTRAGPTAPAHGLTLVRVLYPRS
jgi:tRNA pseudouridine38-40 synthase